MKPSSEIDALLQEYPKTLWPQTTYEVGMQKNVGK